MPISIPNGYVLDEYAQKAWDAIQNGTPVVYIAGKAGVGKSTLVQYIIENTHKECAIVAPTGIAALNVGGSTIHKMFKFPARIIEPKKDVHYTRNSVLENLQLLIIDEISMVRADVMNAIEYSLRVHTGKDIPFGGIQIVLVGDCFQLPPVVTNDEADVFYEKYDSPWWFSASCFDDVDITFVELQKIYRQNEVGFLRGLHAIRMKTDLDKAVPAFNKRCHRRPTHDKSIILTAYRSTAERINTTRLEKLPGPEKVFEARIVGEFKVNENNLPAPMVLTLRVGARVMVTKNGACVVNGTMGTVEEIGEGYIIIVKDDGGKAYITEETWKNYEYKYNKETKHIEPIAIGSFVQYPLVLGWAVTIHKSQGLSLDNVDIDFGGGAFASGQAYVAISRCRTLDGLTFRKPMSASDVIIDDDVIEFYKLNFQGEV